MISSDLEHAVELHRQGRVGEAASLYDRILQTDARNFDALHLRGVACLQQRQLDRAIALIERAISINPNSASALGNLGNAYKALGEAEGARASYERAIKLAPDWPEPLINLGNLLLEQRNFVAAAETYQRALRLSPDSPIALTNYASALVSLGDGAAAIPALQAAIATNPDHGPALELLGALELQAGNAEGAIQLLLRAIALNPQASQAAQNLAVAYQRLGRLPEAVEAIRSAVRRAPSDGDLRVILGALLVNSRHFTSAVSELDAARRLGAHSASFWNHYGVALMGLGRTADAATAFASAVASDEGLVDARLNLAHASLKLGRHADAISGYLNLIRKVPTHPLILGYAIWAKLSVCDWSDIEGLIVRARQQASEGSPSMEPFTALAISDAPEEQRNIASLRAASLKISHAETVVLDYANSKIRIAYFSSDFYDHATSHLMNAIFELHDRQRFEIYAISYSPHTNDAMQQRSRLIFDHFYDVLEMSDLQVVELIRALKIDIAVDLNGYTQHCRPQIFASRCAPIQVSYLGFPGTLGGKAWDYLIADRTIIPPESAQFYSESVVYLDRCYQANSPIALPTLELKRSDIGLPEDAFVFCCFNQKYKILPETLDSWCRIMRDTPDSVIWLLDDAPLPKSNLIKEFAARGVGASRIVWAQKTSRAQHVARQALADLFLDTFPYNAHTTASDALRVGVPVLTLAGRSFASRVATSLLISLGLDELSTTTRQEYEALAKQLACSKQSLGLIRRKLQDALSTSMLFDSRHCTQELERAFLKMLSDFQKKSS